MKVKNVRDFRCRLYKKWFLVYGPCSKISKSLAEEADFENSHTIPDELKGYDTGCE
jgi:hypothetical protein